jgi:hypothetical protein
MAASVQIRRWTGATPTKTDVTSINSRLNAEDAHTTAGTSNSILIPAAGTNYSFWATFCLYIDAISSGTVDNIQWYTDGTGSLGTGVGLVVSTADTYVEATGTEGTSGTELTTGNHAGIAGTPVDAFTYNSGSPLSVDGSGSTTGDVGDQVVLQVTVGSTASSGATAQETLTFRYDDTSS